MRYCTLFLFCLLFAANSFGQSDSIQLLPTRIVTEDTSNNLTQRLILPTRPRYKFTCIAVSIRIVKSIEPFVTVNHKDYSLPVGLPINAFRFQNVNQIANTQAGVFSVDGETPSILGGRTEGTAYYINGVRVLEGFLPQALE